jgi:hypothetical protein
MSLPLSELNVPYDVTEDQAKEIQCLSYEALRLWLLKACEMMRTESPSSIKDMKTFATIVDKVILILRILGFKPQSKDEFDKILARLASSDESKD